MPGRSLLVSISILIPLQVMPVDGSSEQGLVGRAGIGWLDCWGRERVEYLFSVHNVHDYASLQHACEPYFDGEVVLAILGTVAVRCG